MIEERDTQTTDTDWFDKGKEDAWFGRPKQPPEQDPQAASLYDLGYSEGEIERPRSGTQLTDANQKQS